MEEAIGCLDGGMIHEIMRIVAAKIGENGQMTKKEGRKMGFLVRNKRKFAKNEYICAL